MAVCSRARVCRHLRGGVIAVVVIGLLVFQRLVETRVPSHRVSVARVAIAAEARGHMQACLQACGAR